MGQKEVLGFDTKIGVAGDAGSFSEEVGLLYIKQVMLNSAQIVHLFDMDGVLQALSQGKIDLGIFPVANKNSGLVIPAITAMGKYNFRFIDQINYNVEQCIFAKHAMSFKQISTLYSFAPALAQCKKIVQREFAAIPIIDWGDMARAAHDLAVGIITDENAAVLGSRSAAQMCGLTMIAENVQDMIDNTTMFVVVAN